MARASTYVNAFVAGEIGEDAWERSDLQQIAKGCAEASNFLPLVTGPLRSRTGFLDRGAAKSVSQPSRFIPFVRSVADALFVELSAGVARVWTVTGDRILASGAPYEFTTPWAGDRLGKLWFKQVGDVLYVTDRTGGRTYVIKRLADTNWTCLPFDFREGPWLPEAPEGGVTVQPSAASGTVTLTASAAIFSAADIGVLIRIRETDGNAGCQTWTSGTDYALSSFAQFDGRVYQRTAGGSGTKSGTTPPLHQGGAVSDGALFWTFFHDGAGIVRIDSITSPTVAVGAEIRIMPTDQATPYWAKQAYSPTQGYPSALVEEREERLCFAATTARPGKVDMTRTAGWSPDYGDFKPGMGSGRVVDDDAVSLDVGGSSRVVWLLSGSSLIAGCTDGEYVVSGSTLDDPIVPSGRKARPISRFGSADVAPILIQGPPPAIIHVQRGRTSLGELLVSPDNSVERHDRSVLPHHIHDRGIAELAWAGSDCLLWTRLDDGGLAVMRYHSEHQVYAATRQPLPEGWIVESIAAAPLPDKGDALAMIVSRVKSGVTQRRVWFLAPRSAGVFVDGAGIYEGAPTTTVGGLGVFEGETVSIVADGARVPDQTVTGAAVVLPQAAERVVVGPAMLRRFECLPIDMEGVGSTNGRVIVPTHATVIVEAVEVDVTDDGGLTERIRARTPGDQGAPGRRKLRHRASLGSRGSRDARFVVQTSAPFDLTLYAYRLSGEVTE
mgnify:CR=1 FL=1